MPSETLMDLEQATIARQATSPQMTHATDRVQAPSSFQKERALPLLLLL